MNGILLLYINGFFATALFLYVIWNFIKRPAMRPIEFFWTAVVALLWPIVFVFTFLHIFFPNKMRPIERLIGKLIEKI